MQIKRSLGCKYPTVPFGGVDVYASLELSEDDLSDQERLLPLHDRAALMSAKADHMIQSEWFKLRTEVETNLSKYFISILSPEAEKEAIRRGLMKR